MRTASSDNLISPVLLGACVTSLIACAVSLIWGVRLAGGIAAGAATGIGGLWFLSRFVPWMLARRQPKAWMWIALGMKLPVMLAFLYMVIVLLAVNPIGLGIGVGIVPAVITVDAVRARNDRI